MNQISAPKSPDCPQFPADTGPGAVTRRSLHQKQIRELERRRNGKRRELFDAQDSIDQQREELIGKIEKQLKHSSDIQPLFAIRWEIV